MRSHQSNQLSDLASQMAPDKEQGMCLLCLATSADLVVIWQSD